jgi:hypothetical protein
MGASIAQRGFELCTQLRAGDTVGKVSAQYNNAVCCSGPMLIVASVARNPAGARQNRMLATIAMHQDLPSRQQSHVKRGPSARTQRTQRLYLGRSELNWHCCRLELLRPGASIVDWQVDQRGRVAELVDPVIQVLPALVCNVFCHGFLRK